MRDIMEISISFKDGPIEAEITADETDDYEEVLEALSEFVDGYSPTVSRSNENLNESQTVTNENAEEEGSKSEVENQNDSNDGFSTLQEIPESKLQRVMKTGRVDNGDISEHPYVIADTDSLGDTETERLLHTSVLILSVLDEFHDKDRMKTTELKQALADSGLNDDNFGNIDKLDEAEVYLNRRGRGSTATTEIRRPGKDKTKELVANLIEDI